MKILTILLLIPLISPLNYVIDIEGNSVYGNACRYNIQGWIYVHIEGEPYERGYQHGYLLYAEIADRVYTNNWEENIDGILIWNGTL